jgi:hypothetical protein
VAERFLRISTCPVLLIRGEDGRVADAQRQAQTAVAPQA